MVPIEGESHYTNTVLVKGVFVIRLRVRLYITRFVTVPQNVSAKAWSSLGLGIRILQGCTTGLRRGGLTPSCGSAHARHYRGCM